MNEQVLIGKDELLKVFENLQRAEQRKMVRMTLAEASKPLRQAAKREYKAATVTNVKGYASYFKTKVGKRKAVAVTGINYFKARWLNYGTKDRWTFGKGPVQFKKGFRGRVKPTQFFNKAYDANADTTLERATTLLVEKLTILATPNTITE